MKKSKKEIYLVGNESIIYYPVEEEQHAVENFELHVVGKFGYQFYSSNTPPTKLVAFAKRKHKKWLCNLQEVLGVQDLVAILLYTDDSSGRVVDNGVLIQLDSTGAKGVLEWEATGFAGKEIGKAVKAMIGIIEPVLTNYAISEEPIEESNGDSGYEETLVMSSQVNESVV